MITLIVVKNPFKTDREIKQISHIPDQTLLEYITPEVMGFEDYVVSYNGEVIDPDKYDIVIPGPEDFIAVCPVIAGSSDVGKDIARAVAFIAVTIVSMGVGNLVAYGTWAGTAAGWGWGSYVAAAATAYAGGALVNHLLPPPKQDKPQDIFAWSNLPPITKEGGGIPITFGAVKMGVMAPIQVLNQKVTNSGTKSYLNLLLCGGEEVDEIRDIKINNQPVSNYPNVKVDIRLGTNEQTPIPGFYDTWEEKTVGIELKEEDGWVYAQTDGDQGSGLELTFNFPLGLYYKDNKGKLLNEWVRLQIEYRTKGGPWTTWASNTTYKSYNATRVSSRTLRISGYVTDDLRKGVQISMLHGIAGAVKALVISSSYQNGTTTIEVDTDVPSDLRIIEVRYIEIKEKKNTPFSFVTREDNIATGQIEARCRIIFEGTGDKRVNTTVWAKLTHIIYDDFTRPGKSLVGIQALATDRLSGSLNVTWIQSRRNVWIWNPITEQYEQRPANNPAWAAYDIIYRIKRLKNINTGQYEFVVFSDVEPDYMDYQSFADWAAFCESKNLQFNGVIYELTDLWEALAPIEMAGRGKVVIRGTRYSVIFDAPAAPTGMYTVSNILKDSFKIEYIGKKDRANALEITFFNTDNDYEETTVLCYGPGYDETKAIAKPTQLRLPYACSLEQAYREGKYQLRLNHYLNRAIYWKAGIDSLTGRAGEVVYVQHDVPEWGIGGRIAYVSENDVVLDKEVTMEPGYTYGLLVRLADDTLIEKALEQVDETTTTNIVRVVEPFDADKVPETDDVFSFGLYEREAMPVRIVSIKRSGQLHAEIMGLEYIKEIYEEADEIPEIDYRVAEPPIYEVEGLHAAEETFRQRDGTMVSTIRVAWSDPPRQTKADEYYIYYSYDDGETWEWAGTSVLNEFRIMGVKTQETYIVRVCVRIGPAISDGVTSNEVYIYGKDIPPSSVEKMTLTQTGSRIVAAITPVPDPDIRGYEIRMGPSWENSLLIIATDQPKVEFETPNEGSLTFWVKAVDNSGNYSEQATKAQINVFGIPPKNIIYDSDDDEIWSDTRTWRARNGTMYLDPWGRWKIQSKEKVRDYPRFFDIFNSPKLTFVENPELYLPVADLGPNIIEEGYFWVDRFGETHLNSVKKLRDFERFFDIFGVEHELVEPKYATQTLMGIEIFYNQTPNNRVDIEYRTRVDGDGWTEWKTYLEKTFFGRRIEVKLKPYTGNSENVVISGGRMIVDVPDVEEIIENVDIPAAKTRITFRRKFFDPPKSIAIFAADNTGKQAIWRIDPESITRDGFDLELLDDEGNLIAGKLLRASVRGY